MTLFNMNSNYPIGELYGMSQTRKEKTRKD